MAATVRIGTCARRALAMLIALVGTTRDVAAQGTPTATLRLEARVDGNDDLVSFSFIRDLVPLPDGSVVVAEPRENRLRQFAADGTLRGTFGRGGAGPGEFRAIRGVGLVGDSVWVLDVSLRRTTWLASDGTLRGTVRWDLTEDARPGTGYVIGGFLRSGLGWGEPSATPQSVADESAPRRIELLSPSGAERLRSLATVASQHARYRWVNVPTVEFGVQPFADAPLVLGGGARDQIVIVDRRTSFAPSRSFPVSAVGRSGDTLWTVRIGYRPRPIPRAVRDSVVRRLARGLARSGATEADVRAILHLPESYAPVSDAFEDADGRIWLRREEDGPRVAYQRVSATGTLELEVVVDRALRLRAARGDTLWGIRLDEDGVPSLERYTVLSGRAEASP